MNKLLFSLWLIVLTASLAFAFNPFNPIDGDLADDAWSSEWLTATLGTAYDTEAELLALFTAQLSVADIDDTPADDADVPVSSKWIFDNLNDLTDRLTEGITMVSFDASDATPDVSNGGTELVQFWQTANSGAVTTITDFDDTDDHSEFTAGDWFILRMDDAYTKIDFSSNTNIEGNANVDFTGSADQITLLMFIWDGSRWICENLTTGMSDPTTIAMSTLVLPFDESADGTLTTDGQVHVRGDEDRISYDAGAGGEIAGEVTKSFLESYVLPVDFTYVYDRDTNHRIHLFEVNSKLYPNGIIIDYWRVTYTKDPTTELDANLKRADDIIGVANAAVIDALDTTSGAASEDTDANINAGSAVAAGQDIYIEIDADPVDEDVLANFTMYFHAEED